MRARLLRWAIPFAFWSIPALFLTALSMRERDINLYAIFAGVVPWYYWAFISPSVIDYARRHPLEGLRTLRGFFGHAVRALGAGAGCGLISGLVYIIVGRDGGPAAERFLFMTTLFWSCFGTLFYSLIASVGFVLGAQERLRERDTASAQLEIRLVEAQLGALRMQIHPHFLFNTLNTVAMYIREGDAQTSIRALTRLSELLRRLLDDGGAHEVPLRVEIEHAQKYLEIETLRFSDRLIVDFEVPPHLLDCLVPNLVLQPLIENAIRHGIAARSSAGSIRVTATRLGDALSVQVTNDGPPVPNEITPGIGLTNTRMRLAHLYGDRAHLRLSNHGGRVVNEVVLPLHTTPFTMTGPRSADA